MSERPETDKATEGAPKAATQTQAAPKPAADDSHPTTAEKPGTGKPDSDDPTKTKTSYYGRDAYPDGYVMHHEQSGEITLTAPDQSTAVWDAVNRVWADMAGNPMPQGWNGGHQPGTAFDSGPSTKAGPVSQ